MVLIAQVWLLPAATAVKVPVGAFSCPRLLSPQQAMVPSVLMPQVWFSPASMLAETVSGGAVASD